MPRYLKNYDKETKKLIDSIVLTSSQEKQLNKCMEELPTYGNVMLRDVFPDMYRLFVYGIPTERIAEIYSRTVRTIQGIFKDFGVERDKEAIKKLKIHKILTEFDVHIENMEELEEKLLHVEAYLNSY